MTLTIGSLFSGIGGLELGLERAGLGPVLWQVEANDVLHRVLQKHWPHVKDRYHRVELIGRAIRLPRVDLICGGFPCQDLSDASHGKGDGLDGERSGLWSEFARIVGELRPRWVIVENVSGAAERRYVPVVRRDLFRLGYSSMPVRVPASHVGAPFKGNRVFVVAQTYGEGKPARTVDGQMAELSKSASGDGSHWREPAPWYLGVADGVPFGMDRLRALGNAVVPQVAEVIGRRIREVAYAA